MKRLVGLSTHELQLAYGDHRALEIAREAGADAIDFSLDTQTLFYWDPNSLYSKSDEEIIAYYQDIKSRADRLGLQICQTHSRNTGFRDIPEEDDRLVENIRRDLMVTAVLGAPVSVVHTLTNNYLGADADPDRMQALNFHMFHDAVLPLARKYGVKVATETFGDAAHAGCCEYFGNIGPFIESYRRVAEVGDNADYFTVCVDTGHSNKATRFNNNPSPADVIRMLGSCVTVLHLNDNDTFTDQHKMLLTGTIDWDDVLDALDEIGYSGVYNMEVALSRVGGKNMEAESAAFSVKVLRNILRQRYGEDSVTRR